MKIILANPRGFCAGVNMAIESLERALDLFGTPLYVYHEIVHNRPVVERFRRRGVVFVDQIDEVPPGATLLYSAHGVAPAIRAAAAERRLRAIDATCPLVTKVHLEAVRFAREGYTILLIGHEGHDEVLGTTGEAPENIRLVQDAGEVERLELPADARLAYLTQTTLSVDDAEVIIAALKRRFPEIVGPSRDDICYATQNRQEAVKELVPEVDAVIVLGSQNSSNSRASGGAGQRQWAAGLPRGRYWGDTGGQFHRPRDGADHGRGQRPGRGGGGVRPDAARALRGDGRDARGARGARQLPAAARVAPGVRERAGLTRGRIHGDRNEDQ